MTTTASATSLPIYRFKFSNELMEPLTEFSSKHRFDDPELFKVYWDRWETQPQNIALINAEKDRLVSQGYDGDIHEKMYKTVRYYLKNKSLEKKEPKKRRKYITLDKDFLEKMDDHILDVAIVQDLKPAHAYNNFISLSDNMKLVEEQVKELMEKEMTEPAATNKIKKTYKNRYFLQQKN
jgi:hypothetical protein|tara:strand:- start:210 stop:749 length:540 start_codon:yes stop_codon:yes gene_type:complete